MGLRPPGARIPAQRSPYSTEQTAVLDGAASPLPRPYLWVPVAEQTARWQRRQVLWLATVGVDLDRRNIHVTAGTR